MEAVRLWSKNELPVPFLLNVEGEKASAPPATVDMNDSFSKGQVVRYFPNQGRGYIKDCSGREVCFRLSEMVFVGNKGVDEIDVGKTVGYDLAHSGSGLHVKIMKVY